MTRAGRLVRMAAVGGLATGLYAALAWSAATILSLPAALASLLAYLIASVLSYGAHRTFTFGSRRPHGEAVPRFIALNMAGYATALAIPSLVTDAVGAPVWVSVLVTCTLVPAANLAGLSRLVFPAAVREPGSAFRQARGCDV